MQIIVEVKGGCVTAVYSDSGDNIVVDILDYDNYNQETDVAWLGYYKTLEEQAKSMTAIC